MSGSGSGLRFHAGCGSGYNYGDGHSHGDCYGYGDGYGCGDGYGNWNGNGYGKGEHRTYHILRCDCLILRLLW